MYHHNRIYKYLYPKMNEVCIRAKTHDIEFCIFKMGKSHELHNPHTMIYTLRLAFIKAKINIFISL